LPANQSWYDIRAENAAQSVTDVYLYGGIGSYGIGAGVFLDALLSVKSKVINLHIHSPGGDVDDGTAIYNALKEHPATVNVIVDSLAASIASVIAQAGDKRMMAAGSTMMIHEPFIGLDASVRGNATDMRDLAEQATKTADYLDKLAENVAEIYAARAGGDAADWRERMAAESWYRPQEAVAIGLADSVVPAKAQNSIDAFNLADFKHVPEWLTRPAPQKVAAAWKPTALWDAAPYLTHHTETGAVDGARLLTALDRAHNPHFPVTDREAAIRHLEGHAAVLAA